MKVLKVSPKNFQAAIKEAKKLIQEGGVIVCPTDTVYGLIADATNKKAIKRIFRIKKRPKTKPIPVFVKDLAQAKKIAEINKKQEEFLKKAWPGKVTAILKPKKKFPRGIGKPKEEIGLRVPGYRLINILLKKINQPLAETSANISGRPPSVKIKEVLKQFKTCQYQPDLIINAGNLPKSKPSKVIDLTQSPPKILRI